MVLFHATGHIYSILQFGKFRKDYSGLNLLSVIPIILNFIVRSFSDSKRLLKWYSRDEIVLQRQLFTRLSCIYFIQLIYYVIFAAGFFIFSKSINFFKYRCVMQSLFRKMLKPGVNASNSLIFKLEKGIFFLRQDLQNQGIGSFCSCL